MYMQAKLLFDLEKIKSLKSRDLIPFECPNCFNIFKKTKNDVLRWMIKNRTISCCSKKCSGELKTKENTKSLTCHNCNCDFVRCLSALNRKTKYKFCSSSCSASYWNTHKTKGNRRSKLEIWLEKKLVKLYPRLEIHFNKKDAINSELDIYIPSLKLAFELNGIFHYEPIYGIDKLDKTKNNDNRKFQACLEKQIELCIIDVSKIKYFKEKTSIPILEIITNIINGASLGSRTLSSILPK